MTSPPIFVPYGINYGGKLETRNKIRNYNMKVFQSDSVAHVLQSDSASNLLSDAVNNQGFLFQKFIQIPLKDFGEINISLAKVLILVLLIFAVFIIVRIFKKLLNRSFITERLEEKKRRSVLLIIKSISWLTFILISLSITGIEISEIMEYKIFDSDKVNITPTYILVSIIVFIFTGYFILMIKNFFDRQIENKIIDNARGRTVYQFLKYIIWVIVIVVVLQSGGIKLTLFLGAGAALLVGIGFGLQQIFADIISGIFLLFERNVMIDDVLEVEGGIVGRVKEIGIRTSKILTRENVIYIIPNSQIISDKVINWSHAETRTRFYVNVGVAYGSDTTLVKKVLLDVAAAHHDLCKKPIPFVRFNDFGESSLDFQLFFWTRKNFLVENIKSDLRFDIDNRFRENNITIPFPQRDLHFMSRFPK